MGRIVQFVGLVYSDLNPSPTFPPGVEAKINTALSFLMGLGTAAIVAGLMIIGVKMAIANRRGEGEEIGHALFWVVLAGILVTGAASIGKFIVS